MQFSFKRNTKFRALHYNTIYLLQIYEGIYTNPFNSYRTMYSESDAVGESSIDHVSRNPPRSLLKCPACEKV